MKDILRKMRAFKYFNTNNAHFSPFSTILEREVKHKELRNVISYLFYPLHNIQTIEIKEMKFLFHVSLFPSIQIR